MCENMQHPLKNCLFETLFILKSFRQFYRPLKLHLLFIKAHKMSFVETQIPFKARALNLKWFVTWVRKRPGRSWVMTELNMFSRVCHVNHTRRHAFNSPTLLSRFCCQDVWMGRELFAPFLKSVDERVLWGPRRPSARRTPANAFQRCAGGGRGICR